jgi:NADH-quinone oxidoreductase subunit G
LKLKILKGLLMPQIVIDGVRVETSQGKTIIQAAFENGMQITHFCWHPELSVSGNCRMCLVEVGLPKRLPDGSFEKDAKGDLTVSYFPKLQIACATQVSDGMHVRTTSEKAIKAQEAVMEFLLINHPLDCPICDEAGQCKLQDYAFSHSNGQSRFIEEKNHKPKRVSWGPNVLFDAERCISCSRCIRFAKEIARQDVLTFVNRGDKVTIQLFEGTQFDSPYSMNVIDICPVGALTGKDFRFKSRVWDMSFNDSICTGCSRGCNTKIGVRNNEILRIEPRTNLHVNKYWMCDYGRLSQYEFVNDNRVLKPVIKKKKIIEECSFDDALNFAASNLRNIKPNEIMFIGSPNSTNEDLFALSQFAKKIIKTKNIVFLNREDKSFKDRFLKTEDMSSNTFGAIELGFQLLQTREDIHNLVSKIKKKEIKVLYVMEEDFSFHNEILQQLDNLDLLIVHASNHSILSEKADILFPTSVYAEIEGTFTNINKRIQHFEPALVTGENLRIMGLKMSRLDKFGSHNDRWTQHEHRYTRQSWRIIQKLANCLGTKWNYRKSEDVFNDIALHIPSFKGMSYELLDEYRGLVFNKTDKPEPVGWKYVSHVFKPE